MGYFMVAGFFNAKHQWIEVSNYDKVIQETIMIERHNISREWDVFFAYNFYGNAKHHRADFAKKS